MAKKSLDEKIQIRNFGIALAVLLACFGGFAVYHGKSHGPYLIGIGALVLILSLFLKPVLRPVFKGWMWVAEKLSWVMTRLILTIFFYAIMTPIGLVFRLFQVDLLDRKWDKKATSYWNLREDKPYDPKDTERMF